jgi:hypothetical protein
MLSSSGISSSLCERVLLLNSMNFAVPNGLMASSRVLIIYEGRLDGGARGSIVGTMLQAGR